MTKYSNMKLQVSFKKTNGNRVYLLNVYTIETHEKAQKFLRKKATKRPKFFLGHSQVFFLRGELQKLFPVEGVVHTL